MLEINSIKLLIFSWFLLNFVNWPYILAIEIKIKFVLNIFLYLFLAHTDSVKKGTKGCNIFNIFAIIKEANILASFNSCLFFGFKK